MELAFGEKEEQLRKEVRTFLKENIKGEDTSGGFNNRTDEAFEEAKVFNSKLAEKGWIAPAWPKEYGGLGASIYEQMVFNEEFGYHGAPDTGTRGFGVGMIGPTLIVHGTEEQKKKYLPKITSGEHIWCQGYSEPGAGSDLASLQTRAIRDGDDFVINGQKIWTSGGHRANQMFTPRPHRPGGAEAPRHQLPPHRRHQEHPGPHDSPADQHGEPAPLQRGLLRRRSRPGEEPGRRGKPRLVRRDDAARLRAVRHRHHGFAEAHPRTADPAGEGRS